MRGRRQHVAWPQQGLTPCAPPSLPYHTLASEEQRYSVVRQEADDQQGWQGVRAIPLPPIIVRLLCPSSPTRVPR